MSIAGLVQILLTLLILGLIVWLAFWVMAQFGLPEPLAKVIRVVVVVIAVLIVIALLMNIAGIGYGTRILPG
jgi:ABC-type Na+ efflux pump permease subunit